MNHNKLVVIVNGQGGVGKDTLCDYFCKFYNGFSVSSITPIKKRAELIGWTGGKSDKDRKLLSDLKKLLDWYDDVSFNYLKSEFEKFEESSYNVLFVMIREPDDIDRFKEYVTEEGERVCTLLIRRASVNRTFGNEADDCVNDYFYDYIFDNDNPIEISHNDFITMVKSMTDEVF